MPPDLARLDDLYRRLWKAGLSRSMLDLRADTRPGLLLEIGAAGTPSFAALLAPWVLSPSEPVARAAAEAVDQLIRAIPPEGWPALDLQARGNPYSPSGRNGPDGEWARLDRRSLSRFLRFDGRAASLLGLASCHWSGYVREQAVHLLAESRDGAELPFLLLRLNDWVSEVRAAALQAIEERLIPGYAAHFLRHAHLVAGLRVRKRVGLAAVADRIERLVAEAARHAEIDERTDIADTFARRYLCRILIAAAGPDDLDLLVGMLRSEEPLVRLWALRRAARLFDADAIRDIAVPLLQDSDPHVRLDAVHALAKSAPALGDDLLRRALLDPSAGMRSAARFYLARRGAADFAAIYGAALCDPTSAKRVAAIGGLRETGSAADVPLLLPLLDHPMTRTVRAAIRAVAKLSDGACAARLMDLFTDNRRGVSREVLCALLRHVRTVDRSRLRAALEPRVPVHVRLNVHCVLLALGDWESGVSLLDSTRDPEPAVASSARAAVARWLARQNLGSSTGPTPAQVEALSRALALARELPRKVVEGLAFVLRTSIPRT